MQPIPDTKLSRLADCGELGLVSVGDLLRPEGKELHFLIPDYQRGYRWTETEVRELLQDILEFARTLATGYESQSAKGAPIYCLQPLVAMRRAADDGSDRYEVIDGQQRLTTIRLMLARLGKLPGEPYVLEYSTRKGSAGFITELASADAARRTALKREEGHADDIDFHYMSRAAEVIEEFLDPRMMRHGVLSENELVRFAETLIHHVVFIWYCPEEMQGTGEDQAAVVFRRLNVGKIRLTDAELIKALLLTREADKPLATWQQEIALQWDMVENTLREDMFWYFFTQSPPPRTRIEFIFRLLHESEFFGDEMGSMGPYETFRCFEAYVRKDSGDSSSRADRIKKIWSRAMRIYMLLREWYEDAELYHCIGFLLSKDAADNEDARRRRLRELIARRNQDKDSFLTYVKGEIWERCAKKLQDACDGCKCKNGKSGSKNRLCLFQRIWNLAAHVGKSQEGTPLDWGKLEDLRCLPEAYRKAFDGRQDLRTWVANVLYGRLKSQDYGEKTRYRPLLLLHNVQTFNILNRNDKQNRKPGAFSRFPFHLYNRIPWDVEHIDSATPNDLENVKDQRAWLLNEYSLLSDTADDVPGGIKEGMAKFFGSAPPDATLFEKLDNAIQKRLDRPFSSFELLENKNCISNYALLDSSTNRSYKNAIFPLKRKLLLARERGEPMPEFEWRDGDIRPLAAAQAGVESTFVPPCTMAAFLKKFSGYNANANLWTAQDAEAYLQDICEKLTDFLFTAHEDN